MSCNSWTLCGLLLSGSALLFGCGDDKGGDNNSAPQTTQAGRDTSAISYVDYSTAMTFDHCSGGTSQYATNDFYVGTTGAVSADTLIDIVKAAQLSFETLNGASYFNVNAATDLAIDSANRLEICIDPGEGSNGAGYKKGIIIGASLSGSNLDFILDHELTHVIATNILGKDLPSVLSERWFDEGLATLFADNVILTKSQMSSLINLNSGGILTPANVASKGAEDIWSLNGENTSHFYPAYNTVLRYSMHLGASKSDFIQILFKMREIEQGCQTQQASFYSSTGGMHGSNSFSSMSNACNGLDTGYETTYNGSIIDSNDVFQVAFDEVMSHNGSGLTMSQLRDNTYFVNNVVNGFLN